MTVRNNDVLFNAALAGYWSAFAEGLVGLGYDTNSPAGSPTQPAAYVAQTANALAFAEAVDAAIPNDNAGALPVSVVTTGVPISPSSGAIGGAAYAKTALLCTLCANAMRGRIPPPLDANGAAFTEADFAQPAAAIAVAYFAAWPSFQVT